MTVTRALTLRAKAALSRLSSLWSVPGSRIWWPFIQEPFAGAWQQNQEIQVNNVLANPTLYACVTLIAGDIAKLRPMIVEQDSNRIWSEVELAGYSAVLEEPNGYQEWVDFAEWWMESKLCHGNLYALKARDGRNMVQALYILDPFRVTPLVAPDGSVFYQLGEDPLADIAESIVVPAREIIHDRICPLFHPLVGISPIYAAGFPAVQGLNTRTASDKFFTNGARPGGVLTAPGQIAQATADRIKAYWDANFSGNNTGKIAVLGDGMKYEQMAMTAEQSQLVEQLRMTDEDIAKCFHMPRHKVGIGPDPTYTNIEALNQQYYTDCLQKHIVKMQRKLTTGLGLDLVPGRELAVELDLDDLLMMDSASRIKAGADAIGSGGMSPNEARFRYFDLGPVEGGDSPYLQQQNYSLQALARRDAQADPFNTPSAQRSGVQDITPPDQMPETQAASLMAELMRKELAMQVAA